MTNEQADRPRILFVANRILGWNTYSNEFSTILGRWSDVDHSTLWRRPGRFSTLFVKRHDIWHSLERVFRRVDPIVAYQGRLGREIRAAVRNYRPDIVHFASHWPAAAMLNLENAPPFTVSLDCTRANIEDDFETHIWTKAEMQAEASFLSKARRIYPMSKWAKRSLRDDYGINQDQIALSPPAQDLGKFVPTQAHDGLPNVIFIGNDFRRKGGARLVKWALDDLQGKFNLHIVSSDPDAAVSGPNITVHGRMPHDDLVQKLLPQMDILCLPTKLDMSPHVLVEAAAASLPAVASDLGGIPDIVLNDKTGFVIAPDDDAGFVAALDRLISTPDLRHRMAAQARAHAMATFHSDKVYSDLMTDLVSIALGARDEFHSQQSSSSGLAGTESNFTHGSSGPVGAVSALTTRS